MQKLFRVLNFLFYQLHFVVKASERDAGEFLTEKPQWKWKWNEREAGKK